MVDLVIPDPCLVVLVAAAGAGKSTFAARHFDPAEILSSDAYRARIAGDEADQRATRAAFEQLHRDLEQRLADRRLTVVDATNVERSARLALRDPGRDDGPAGDRDRARPALDDGASPQRRSLVPDRGRACRCSATWPAFASRWTARAGRSTVKGSRRSSCSAIRPRWMRSGSADGSTEAPGSGYEEPAAMHAIAAIARTIPTAWPRVTRSCRTIVANTTVVTG